MSNVIGESIPPNTRHAISVSLPTWEACVGYEEGDPDVVERMETGYPRFFIHKSVEKLRALLVAKYAKETETCMIFPSYDVAKRCREFMKVKGTPNQPTGSTRYRILQLSTSKHSNEEERMWKRECKISVVFFPEDQFYLAKKFWQHSGEIISSRLAEYVLHELFELVRAEEQKKKQRNKKDASDKEDTETQNECEEPIRDEEDFIEQRYGRNLDFSFADEAKAIIKRRISKQIIDIKESSEELTASFSNGNRDDMATAAEDSVITADAQSGVEGQDVLASQSSESLVSTIPAEPIDQEEFEQINISASASRDRIPLTVDPEKDVYLFPSGMASLFTAHRLLLQLDSCRVNRTKQDEPPQRNTFTLPHSQTGSIVGYGPPYKKTVMFGFPYTDTLSILRTFNHTHFLGSGDDNAMEELKSILQSGEPILAVFIETPSNPLLKMGDILELRKLADIYAFYLVVDDTIGGFVNIDVLPYTDMVCNSLTKIFSGDSNVTAGSIVLNSNSRLYDYAQQFFHDGSYEDLLWCEDAIYLERNSRDCTQRVLKINHNTERLLNETLIPLEGKLFKKIYYPSLTSEETKKNYDAVRCKPSGGYGGLFSLTFFHESQAKTFFNELNLCKGPSLGTNFTLACPYTILAHYAELDEVAKYGVERNLVRVSVGLEDVEHLQSIFTVAAHKAMNTLPDKL